MQVQDILFGPSGTGKVALILILKLIVEAVGLRAIG
jgi:hypothetical protein